MGWWIALGVIFLLGILPLGVSARYSGEGPVSYTHLTLPTKA